MAVSISRAVNKARPRRAPHQLPGPLTEEEHKARAEEKLRAEFAAELQAQHRADVAERAQQARAAFASLGSAAHGTDAAMQALMAQFLASAARRRAARQANGGTPPPPTLLGLDRADGADHTVRVLDGATSAEQARRVADNLAGRGEFQPYDGSIYGRAYGRAHYNYPLQAQNSDYARLYLDSYPLSVEEARYLFHQEPDEPSEPLAPQDSMHAGSIRQRGGHTHLIERETGRRHRGRNRR